METEFARHFWENKAKEEAVQNQILKLQHGRGICSVFILDTSESMSGEGLRQMKEALIYILNEYKALNTDDNVAVIGFGEETKFLHYYSNNYDSIIKCLDNIKCKGPSPLEAGIILSFSCIKLGGGHTVISTPLILRARVVVISDGNPTDMINRRETMETTIQSETFHRIQSLVKRQGKWNPFTFIPVGKSPNYELLGALAVAAKGGRILGWEEARLYARLSVNFQKFGKWKTS